MAYERIMCPKCELSFGQEARFYEHLKDLHDVSDPLTLYLETFYGSEHPRCRCSSACDFTLSWSGWKKGFTSNYVRGHNAKVSSVYLDKSRQSEFAQKRKEGYASGQYSAWNKGLTKENSEKVAKMSAAISSTLQEGYSSGRIVDWREADPVRASSAAAKCSATKKIKFESGELKSWNEGLTKETNSSLASAAEKIKARYQLPDAGRRIKSDELDRRISSHSGKFRLISSLDDYRRRRIERLKFVCVNCDAEQMKSLAMLEESPVCFSCAPKESKGQLEVYDFVASLSPDAVLSDRSLISPKEIDILAPSAKLAIEYNGLYWHSVANIPDKNYHEAKRKAIEAAGHKFFMIFEDEWRERRSVVEGMLRHRLGVPGEILDARKLRVEKLDNKTAEVFFESSHLEGHARSSSCLGLVDSSGRVVAAMSLRRPFHASRAESSLEVARSACLPGVTIRGWMGKLTSASLRVAKSEGTQSLVSYVDARVGCGKSYLTAGWTLESEPRGPRFWWTDHHHRFNRFKYKADSALGLSQADVAAAAGVVEIWGCGNYVVKIS
jgi:hypothetical protein